MVNVEKARETIDVIRQNPHRFDMSRYVGGRVNPEAATWQECGTTMCLASWRCALDGLRPCICVDVTPNGLFVNPADGVRHYPDDWAAESLGLDEEQANVLFDAVHITDVEDHAWALEAIIAGRRVDRCPNCREGRDDDGEPCEACVGRGLVLAREDDSAEARASADDVAQA